MEDKQATPPLGDVRFFRKIAADIRVRPRFYRDAGKWLDRNYGDAAFEKKERAEWKERLRRAKAGQTTAAKAVIRALKRLRGDKEGQMGFEEAVQLVPDLARRNIGMSESRLADIREKVRTGHLAPDADLRPLTPEEKAKWPAMSGAERQDLCRHMALTTEEKKQRDMEREELYAVDRERNRLNGLVKGYYLGNGHEPYYDIQQTYRKWGVRKSFLMLRRFVEATLPFREDPPAFPTATESKRILLMTWLMTDDEADKWGLGLTEFEKWPWDVAGRHLVHGRRYASNWWLSPSTEYSDWVALARRAWERVKPAAHAFAAPGGANVQQPQVTPLPDDGERQYDPELVKDTVTATQIAEKYHGQKVHGGDRGQMIGLYRSDGDKKPKPDYDKIRDFVHRHGVPHMHASQRLYVWPKPLAEAVRLRGKELVVTDPKPIAREVAEQVYGPRWTCECGHVLRSKKEPVTCPACGKEGLFHLLNS